MRPSSSSRSLVSRCLPPGRRGAQLEARGVAPAIWPAGLSRRPALAPQRPAGFPQRRGPRGRSKGFAIRPSANARALGRGGDGAEEHRLACPDQGEGEVHIEKRQGENEEGGRGRGMAMMRR
eukprot:2320594-Pyramimonas_sp.AAC.1